MPFTPSDPKIVPRIRDEAVRQLKLRGFGVFDSVTGDSGEYWSDENVTGGDFLAFYADLEEHVEDVQVMTGVDEQGQPVVQAVPIPVRILDHLRVIAPHHAEALDRQRERELAKMLEGA